MGRQEPNRGAADEATRAADRQLGRSRSDRPEEFMKAARFLAKHASFVAVADIFVDGGFAV